VRRSSATEWRDGFLFLGNHLALDFINTRPVLDDAPQELLADWPSLVRWFRAAELIDSRQAAMLDVVQPQRALQTLEAIRNFRERLRKELLAWEDGAQVRSKLLQELNELMAEHPMLTKVKSDRGKLTKEQWFLLQEPNDLFAPLAHAAVNLFSDLDRGRVRKCEHCVLHFHDTSKIGNRRWCSMRFCGNRAKVAAYAARRTAHAN
jgi:predicted RNA-binding Zn ribbon-like protein